MAERSQRRLHPTIFPSVAPTYVTVEEIEEIDENKDYA
jgi:hypothetical protein